MNDIGLNERIFILFGSRQNAVESRFPKEKQERAPRMNSNGSNKSERPTQDLEWWQVATVWLSSRRASPARTPL